MNSAGSTRYRPLHSPRRCPRAPVAADRGMSIGQKLGKRGRVTATIPWQGTGRTRANEQPNSRSWGELQGLSAGSSNPRGPGASVGIQPPTTPRSPRG